MTIGHSNVPLALPVLPPVVPLANSATRSLQTALLWRRVLTSVAVHFACRCRTPCKNKGDLVTKARETPSSVDDPTTAVRARVFGFTRHDRGIGCGRNRNALFCRGASHISEIRCSRVQFCCSRPTCVLFFRIVLFLLSFLSVAFEHHPFPQVRSHSDNAAVPLKRNKAKFAWYFKCRSAVCLCSFDECT